SIKTARDAYRSGITRKVNFRKTQLKALINMIEENEELMVKCLMSDLSKPRNECFIYEIDAVKNAAVRALNQIDDWFREDQKRRPLINFFDKIYTVRKPYGVVLIIGAWNYPIVLTLLPAIGAIAAGNCVIFKPSEISESVAAFLQEMIPRYLNKVECFHVISGGVEETSMLLREKLDYIFFTGSKDVGKIIYESAARQLTPVTLECGGKCPVFIDNGITNIEMVVRRIVWGKCVNSGQTCVAPDYVLCSADIQEQFVSTAKQVIKEFYSNFKDYTRIVNEIHCRRIERLLNESNGRIAVGGKIDVTSKFIEPTIVVDVTLNDSLMREEIFGPVLPIIVIKDCDEAIELLSAMSEPLCIYLFTDNKSTIDKFNEDTRSGSLVCNDVLVQLVVDELPFGGLGESGFGRYFGKHSFDTFSYEKSVMVRNKNILLETLSSIRYPPHYDIKTTLSRNILKNYHSFFPLNLSMLPNAVIFAVSSAINRLKKVIFNFRKFRMHHLTKLLY
ncbi:aldehyde dehydrogenase: dimeric NADP-preferring-like isoform X4, partial [Leptotrombidium deliense]